jgi:tetratricopeptide (TPR) repeat protein
MAETKRAKELDPLRVVLSGQEGVILFYARRYDEAVQRLQDAFKLEPENGVTLAFLGYAYAARGQYAEAIGAYQKQISLDGETTSTLCYLGHAYAKSGKRDEALSVLDKLKRTKEYVSPSELAVFYAGLGDKEAAFESLERAYAAHDPQLQNLKVDPFLDPLRADPRFQDLVRRVGLPQ